MGSDINGGGGLLGLLIIGRSANIDIMGALASNKKPLARNTLGGLGYGFADNGDLILG